MKAKNTDEQFNISFMGIFRYTCTNPTNRTIYMLLIFLIFFLALAVLLKWYILPATAIQPAKDLIKTIASYVSKLTAGRSP